MLDFGETCVHDGKMMFVTDEQISRPVGLRSVTNALRVLEVLASGDPEMGVTDISKLVHLSKSTVHAVLSTLMAEGFVEKNPATSRYRLTLKLYELGCRLLARSPMDHRVLPLMEALGRATNETVSLAVLSGREALLVQRVESTELLRADLQVGTRVPLHATATGKVLLAFLPDRELELYLKGPLEPYTQETRVDPVAIRKELEDVRAVGLAKAVDEMASGIAAMAVPVFDHAMKVVCALSIAAPTGRYRPEAWERPLRQVGAKISELFGCEHYPFVAVP
jgi:IclR family KDG regulon transcriptional repressor